jgi:hypothetical protein
MIPDKSSACWRQLATGSKTVETQILGLQLLLKRIHRTLEKASDAAAINSGAEEIHAFFIKFEKILPNEIKSL